MNVREKADTITEDGEIITGPVATTVQNTSLAVSLARAEVDQQITTAHAYPRSVNRAMKSILSLATLDEETAEECVYALPRGGKPIKGPSVRLAEIIQGQWGNCRVGARVVHVDRFERYVEAEGVFHDLETNSATTARVRRRISDKNGRIFNEDMIVVTGNAACSIAKRNAILGGVPKAVWRKAYTSVESVIAGDVKTLTERRDRAMKAFAAFGVTPDQVFVALGIGGLEDVTLDHISTLVGMHAALKSGEATVEEMFPRAAPTAAAGAPKDLNGKLNDLAKADASDATLQPGQTGDAGTKETTNPQSSGKGDTTSPKTSANPATESSNSNNQAQETSRATTAADTSTSVAGEGAAPKGQTAPAPKNTAEYRALWNARIESLTTFHAGEAALETWNGEKALRNSINIEPDLRVQLKDSLDAAVAELRSGE